MLKQNRVRYRYTSFMERKSTGQRRGLIFVLMLCMISVNALNYTSPTSSEGIAGMVAVSEIDPSSGIGVRDYKLEESAALARQGCFMKELSDGYEFTGSEVSRECTGGDIAQCLFDCKSVCIDDDDCMGFDYQTSTGKCWKVAGNNNNPYGILADASGYRPWKKMCHYEEYYGYPDNYPTNYGILVTSCDLDTFKDTLSDGYGFYFDPASDGQCRSIEPQHFQTIKNMNENDDWTFDLTTGITSIPLGIYCEMMKVGEVGKQFRGTEHGISCDEAGIPGDCFDHCKEWCLKETNCIGFDYSTASGWCGMTSLNSDNPFTNYNLITPDHANYYISDYANIEPWRKFCVISYTSTDGKNYIDVIFVFLNVCWNFLD